MPSITHQALVEMFRSRPTLAVEFLRGALHIAVPVAPVIAPVEASLDDLVSTEHRADLVLALRAEDDAPVIAVVIVEVQLGRDADKPWTWPLYLAVLRAHYHCPVWLLGVAPAEEIATWAASPPPKRSRRGRRRRWSSPLGTVPSRPRRNLVGRAARSLRITNQWAWVPSGRHELRA